MSVVFPNAHIFSLANDLEHFLYNTGTLHYYSSFIWKGFEGVGLISLDKHKNISFGSIRCSSGKFICTVFTTPSVEKLPTQLIWKFAKIRSPDPILVHHLSHSKKQVFKKNRKRICWEIYIHGAIKLALKKTNPFRWSLSVPYIYTPSWLCFTNEKCND